MRLQRGFSLPPKEAIFTRIAVITGASSGLGAEFARRLARAEDVEELWLIARRAERLEALAAEAGFADRMRLLALDLEQEQSLQQYEQLLEADQPEILWLVNAAGFAKMGSNAEIGRAALDRMLQLNCRAAMDMTQISLPFMARGSHILEICSTAAFMPLGGLGVYAASKSFLLSYSRSLYYEVRTQGIVVTAVCPYWIKDTEFIPTARQAANSKAVRHFPLASRARPVAARALRDTRLGLPVSTPGPVCTLHRLVCKFIPRDLLMLAWAGIRRL